MGPMAPIVLREHVRSLGADSGSLLKGKLAAWAKELGKEIADEEQRASFNKELLEEIEKLATPANGVPSGPSRTQGSGGAKPMAKKETAGTPELLQIISAKLSDAMGPMAPLVLRERIAALGEAPESFPRTKLEELIVQVSVEIFDESTRRNFQMEMARQIQGLKQKAGKS